ncbi:MAG TPA: heme o synthase [bacterium]|nr:heme o synthase [bacterium]
MLSPVVRRYQGLAVATAVAAYLLVLLGGLVRITGSGMACPDWPLCHGRLVPPLEGPILIEYAHRLVAASVSVLVLATAIAAFAARRAVPRAGTTAVVILALVAVQVVLGGVTVKMDLTPGLVTTHLGVAMLFLAGLLVQAVISLRGPAGSLPAPASFRGLAWLTLAATYVMILIGGFLGSSGAALACPSLPACRGPVFLPPDWQAHVHMLHRAWGVVVTILVIATAAAAARTGARGLAAPANLAVVLVLAQFAAGVLNVATRLSPAVQGVHLGLAAALFGVLVVLATLAGPQPEPARAGVRAGSKTLRTIAGSSVDDPAEAIPWTPAADRPPAVRAISAVARDYVMLMKPRIILLLLVTTVTTMIVAAPHHLSLSILMLTVLGGTLAAGSANAFNMYLDRDIDAVMQRTCLRPVPSGRLRPTQAVGFGIATGLLSIVVLAWGVNALSAALSTAGLLFYVAVYTRWLKRTTPQNIVIGGAAGAVPPLVGWAAASGHLAAPAVALFAIVFLWTPPHFWALALAKTDDYRAAGVPMLPVVRGEQETRRQIFLYSLALSAATLVLYAPLRTLGPLYLALATVLDAVFVLLAWAVLTKRSPRAEMNLFGYSLLYLALLFAGMVVDRLIG